MKQKSKNKSILPKIIMTLLTISFISFIFIHSSMPAVVSNEESTGFTDILNKIITKLGLDIAFENGLVRKLAHFSEFFILGSLLTLTDKSYQRNIPKDFLNLLFLGLIIAIIDETIQLFVEGRAGMIKDVWIDFSGAFCGTCIIMLIILFFDAKKKDTKK